MPLPARRVSISAGMPTRSVSTWIASSALRANSITSKKFGDSSGSPTPLRVSRVSSSDANSSNSCLATDRDRFGRSMLSVLPGQKIGRVDRWVFSSSTISRGNASAEFGTRQRAARVLGAAPQIAAR